MADNTRYLDEYFMQKTDWAFVSADQSALRRKGTVAFAEPLLFSFHHLHFNLLQISGSELWPFRVQQERKFRRFRPRVPAQGKLKWRTTRATLMNILCKRRGRLLFLPIGAPSGGKDLGSELWPFRVRQQRKFRRFRPRVPAQGKLKWRTTRATLMNILCKRRGRLLFLPIGAPSGGKDFDLFRS
ncbi:hypothetical protein CDAR_400231 [Caerostris darwini]|uniref:Uncharacterized protein n=1 Tax=Caerostris darwini TaxID=1538125 RepID=A0AAV4SCM7_9ARAC|nr:hypothetical protein CDAR_400231 [Caerostris darwini]